MTTNQIVHLSDDALIDAIARAAATEREATACLLRLIMEVDRRRLYLGRGFPSMFAYCTRALRFSEQAAYSRITAARAARRFPRLLDELAAGELTLSSVGLLAPHLTDENVEMLMEGARGRSTREVERMIAGLHAQPDIPATVRALPEPKAEAPVPAAGARMSTGSDGTGDTFALARGHEPRPAPGPLVAPIAPARYLLKVTVSAQTHDTLQRLRALMRHSVPDGDPATIVERALRLLLHQVERQKVAAAARPRGGSAGAPAGRTIPATVRRAVWTRDAGRCTFDGTDGRCGETAFLEFHHVVPFAAGGGATADNIQLRCRAHNAHEAMLFFGTDRADQTRLRS
jgi:hypothetical protein